MKKNQIYVVIDTPKKAKKVKKVLDMFGEKINYATNNSLVEYKMSWLFNENKVPAVFFNSQKVWIGDHVCGINDRKEVSIKELKQILAFSNLKEGDVVVCENKKADSHVFKIKRKYGNSVTYDNRYSFIDEKTESVYGSWTLDYFKRYATDEEKLLLEPKPKELTIADYKLGVWYKSKNGSLLYFNDTDYTYGFLNNGNFRDDIEWIVYFKENDFHIYGHWAEASDKEVFAAINKEAENRFGADWLNVEIKAHVEGLTEWSTLNTGNFSTGHVYNDRLYNKNGLIYYKGKWADIVGEPKRVRVIDGGSGATGCNGMTGIIVDKPIKNKNGSLEPVLYVKLDNGETWGLAKGYKIEEIESGDIKLKIDLRTFAESSKEIKVAGQDLPTFTTKDLATIIAMKEKLQELEDKFSKLV